MLEEKLRKLLSWIGGSDDVADTGLVETFVSILALEQLEMRTDGTLVRGNAEPLVRR